MTKREQIQQATRRLRVGAKLLADGAASLQEALPLEPWPPHIADAAHALQDSLERYISVVQES